MTQSATPPAIFITAPEGGTGKSTVALGLLRLLAASDGRVGVFRPITRYADKPDHILEAMLEHATADLDYDACVGVNYDRVHADPEQALAEIVERFHAMQSRCDAVVVLGSDYTDVAAPSELAFNARIAVNLGAPVLLVISAFERDIDQVAALAHLSLGELSAAHAHTIATVVNRCDPDELDRVPDALVSLGMPIFALPEVPLLVAPTMAELVEAVGGEFYAGDPELLHREAMSVMVGGMTAEHILERLVEGQVVIVPADRSDVLLALVAAHGAEGFPALAGIIMNGGLTPHRSIDALIRGMRLTLPMVRTDLGTYKTAAAAARTRGRIAAGSMRKIDTALDLVARHIDADTVLERLRVPIPTVTTPQMFEYHLHDRARRDRRTVVLPEGGDDRVLRAAGRLLRRGIVDLILLGEEPVVRQRAAELGLDLAAATVIDPVTSELREGFIAEYVRLRAHRGMTRELAAETMLDVSYFGTMMVHLGHADGMVSGAMHTTAHTIRPSFEIIKTRPGIATVSSVFFMALADRVLVYGDAAVVPDPTTEQLADIAISSARTAADFGIDPKVAMLSYSTGASGSGADVDKVRAATALVRERAPELAVDGPLQYDAAVEPSVAASKMPDSPVAGQASVLIFPDLNTGNNTYKAVQRSAGAIAIGPVLQGLRRPVNDLSRGATVTDIVNTVAITAVQAQQVAADEAAAGEDGR